MSDRLPAGWDLPQADADRFGGPSSSSGAQGVWDLDITVNTQTSIACVDLPHFSKDRPLQGTKPARKSILKLLEGKCNDVSPLNYRDETEEDQITVDPYFKVAPGWSSLSGGKKPFITIAPVELAEKLTSVSQCVPFVRAVRIFVVDAQGKRRVSLEELRNLNVEVQIVPNMYRQAAAAASRSNGVAAAAAVVPSADVARVTERQDALQAQLTQMQALLTQLAAAAQASVVAPASVASGVAAAAPAALLASAAATAQPSAPAVAAAPAPHTEGDDDNDDAPLAPKGHRSKKARVV